MLFSSALQVFQCMSEYTTNSLLTVRVFLKTYVVILLDKYLEVKWIEHRVDIRLQFFKKVIYVFQSNI